MTLNTTGSDNTALSKNTTGGSNTAIGESALLFNTTASQNVAIGSGALFTQSLGSGAGPTKNVAVGYQALYKTQPDPAGVTGIYNVALGSETLYNNTSGGVNTALGMQALNGNTTGHDNTAVGGVALKNNTTGNNNIDLGNSGVAGESNTIRIGAGSVGQTFVAGISGTIVSGGSAVVVSSSGQLGVAPSSRRFKQNIQPMEDSSDSLLALRPVTFQYKPALDPKGIPQWGLIAEEVNEVNPDLVVRDAQGQVQGVRYEQVNAMLLNEFLKEHQRVETLQSENVAMKNQLASQKAQLADLESKNQERDAKLTAIEERLNSNVVANTR